MSIRSLIATPSLLRMRGRTILLITASWAFVAVVAIALYRRDTEPSYNGRTFAQWIKASSQASADPATHEAILSITTNSAPLLLRWASRSSAWNWPCQRR
jgi:hypothetical protein